MGATGVAALAAFAREFPREFEQHEKKALSFAMARMAGTIGGEEEEEDSSGGGGDGRRDGGGKHGKGKVNAGKKNRGGGGGKKAAATSAVISPSCQTLSAAIELGCNCLMAPGQAGAGAIAGVTNSGGGGGDAAADGGVEGWMKTVLALLEAEGQPESEGEMSRAERAELRLAGSTCVVRLCVSSTRAQVRLLW